MPEFPKKHFEQIKEKPWNAEVEITENSWGGAIKKLEEYRKIGNWRDFADFVKMLRTIDRKKDLGIKKQEDLEGLSKSLENCRKEDRWEDFAKIAAGIKSAFPEVDLSLGQKDWEGMGGVLEYWSEKGDWGYFSDHAVNIKFFIKPEEQFYLDRHLDQKAWKGMREVEIFDRKRGGWTQTARRRILKPEADLGLTQDDWEALRKKLKNREGDDLDNFFHLAMIRKILASRREIKILPGGGLEID